MSGDSKGEELEVRSRAPAVDVDGAQIEAKKKEERAERRRKEQEEQERAKKLEEERNALLEFLNQGCVFIKYGRQGAPHPREVFVTDGGLLYWAKPGERHKKKEAKYMDINVSQKVEVLKGKQTAVLKSRGQTAEEKLCFSVTSEFWYAKPIKRVETRTLDLLCKSEAERDKWANAVSQWREIQFKKIEDEKRKEEEAKEREREKQRQAEEKAKREAEAAEFRRQEEIRLAEEKRRAEEAKQRAEEEKRIADEEEKKRLEEEKKNAAETKKLKMANAVARFQKAEPEVNNSTAAKPISTGASTTLSRSALKDAPYIPLNKREPKPEVSSNGEKTP